MNRLYIVILISSAVSTHTIFSMEEQKGIIATLRGVIRRGSFSSKKTEEEPAPRIRSNSSSGFSLPMWRAKTKAILLQKSASFTSEEYERRICKINEYINMGKKIQASSSTEWTQKDSENLAQLSKLVSQEVNNNDKNSSEQSLQQSFVVESHELGKWHENATALTDIYLKRKYTDVAHNKKAADCILDGIQILEKINQNPSDELKGKQEILKLLCDYYIKQTEQLQDVEIQKKRTVITVFINKKNVITKGSKY